MNRFDSRGGRSGGPPPGGAGRFGGRGRDDSGPGRRPPFRPRYKPTAEEQFGDARVLTFEALGAFEHRRAFVSDALEQLFEERHVTPQDRGLATEMAYGITRRLASIDALIEACCDRPREMVQDGLWRLMRMGVYQLAWLNSIPPHAAIHETVELARRLGQPGWCGFLNAVLRRLQREVLPTEQSGWTSVRTVDELVNHPDTSWLPLRSQEQTGHQPTKDQGPRTKDSPGGLHPPLASELTGRQTPPCSPVLTGLQLRQPVFPDPDQHRAAFWADAFSFPEWMIDEWCLESGEKVALERAAWFNTAGRMCLRVNLMRATREQMLAALQRMGVAAFAGRWPESILLETPVPVSEIPGFRDGLVSIQDESAISAAALLAPQPGWRVLDLCAAPGGKTAHMAEQMNNQGQVIACDTVAKRLPLIVQNCQRLGISIVETREILEDGSNIPNGPFHAVLVDVPCSNTGVLGKRPEVRWRYVPGELRELTQIQSRLLRKALELVGPGGRIVYSTCSIDVRENGELVRQALNEVSGFRLVEERNHQPGLPVDGGYAALIIRN